jgi:hypothetical protein
MPPKSQRSLTRSLDWYAAWRCSCGHLCYSDDVAGGNCRWERCSCTDHRPAVQPKAAS